MTYLVDVVISIEHIDLILVVNQHHVSKSQMHANIIHVLMRTDLVPSAFQLTMYGVSKTVLKLRVSIDTGCEPGKPALKIVSGMVTRT